MPSHPLTTCLNTIMSATGKLGEHCVTLNSSFIAQINYKDIQQIKHWLYTKAKHQKYQKQKTKSHQLYFHAIEEL